MSIEDDQAEVIEQYENVLKEHPDADFGLFWHYINQFHELYNNDEISIGDLVATLELAKSELEEIAD